MVLTPDTVNAAFEMGGGLVVLLNIRCVLRDRLVRGIDWRVMAFFTVWAFWSLYYYPYLGQWWSFGAGVFLAAANAIYLALLVHFVRKEVTDG